MTSLSIQISSNVDLCDTVQTPLHKPPGSVGFESKQSKRKKKTRSAVHTQRLIIEIFSKPKQERNKERCASLMNSGVCQVSVSVFQYLFVSVKCLSSVCQCLSVCVSVCQCLVMTMLEGCQVSASVASVCYQTFSVYQCLSVPVSVCQCLFVPLRVYQMSVRCHGLLASAPGNVATHLNGDPPLGYARHHRPEVSSTQRTVIMKDTLQLTFFLSFLGGEYPNESLA